MKLIIQLLAAGTLLALMGCGGESSSQDKVSQKTNATIVWDLSKDDELMAYTKIQMKTYLNGSYTEVTNGATPSAFPDTLVRVWVNNSEAINYQNLSTSSQFPVGTTVIRIVVDEQDNPIKTTVSVKGPIGVNPASDDWIFAVGDADGVISPGDDGELQFGAIESCNDCHTTKLDTDGLYGLP